jgi:hypothetical protein
MRKLYRPGILFMVFPAVLCEYLILQSISGRTTFRNPEDPACVLYA